MSTSTTQLQLPFDFDALHTWTDAAGDPEGIELTVCLTPTGARLQLMGPWPTEGTRETTTVPLRGVLWSAEVDAIRPEASRVDPAPQGAGSPGPRFLSSFPVDCFTPAMAWAMELGRPAGLELDGLLMAMRRSLVQVASHLEQLHQHQPPRRHGCGASGALSAVAC